MASQRNKTAADIRESHGRKRLPIAIAARIPEFKAVCAAWHNLFGACLVLDRERMSALTARIVDGGVKLDDVLLAIDGYHVISGDRWHAGDRSRTRTLSSFLNCERFEQFVEDGRKARRQAAERQSHARHEAAAGESRAREQLDQSALRQRVRDYYAALPADRQKVLLAAALATLPPAYRSDLEYRARKGLAALDLSNRFLLSAVCGILQPEISK